MREIIVSGEMHKGVGFNTFNAMYQADKRNAYYSARLEEDLKMQDEILNPVAFATSNNAYIMQYNNAMKA